MHLMNAVEIGRVPGIDECTTFVKTAFIKHAESGQKTRASFQDKPSRIINVVKCLYSQKIE